MKVMIKKIKESYRRKSLREATSENKEKLPIVKTKGGIVVRGIDDVAVRFSRCCNPIPGDEIVGFVTRGRVALFIVLIVLM